MIILYLLLPLLYTVVIRLIGIKNPVYICNIRCDFFCQKQHLATVCEQNRQIVFLLRNDNLYLLLLLLYTVVFRRGNAHSGHSLLIHSLSGGENRE